MTDVFISYARQDSDFAHKLTEALNEHHKYVWVDWADIPPTADWQKEISAGIESAETFVCVLSPDFVVSALCQAEVDQAIGYGKRLVPLLYRAVDPTMVNSPLAGINWLFFRETDEWDSALKTLIQTLDTDPDHIHMSTALLVRAREWENKGRDPSYTLRGRALDEAEEWLAKGVDKKPPPTALHMSYIGASRRANRGIIGMITGTLQSLFSTPHQELVLRSSPQVVLNELDSHRNKWQYDVALSYASEDRTYVQVLADSLSLRGVTVFYDQYEKSTLWGKNLYTYLSDIYQNKAHYCVMFISQHYANKVWTTHEREAAQARAFKEKEEYILPIRLDETEIPGFLPTIAYLNWHQENIKDVTDFLVQKLNKDL